MTVSKNILFASFFLLASPAFATAGYLGLSISEFDVLGCQNNENKPRCKKIIKVACQSICHGHEGDGTEFGKACKNLCNLPVKQDAKKNKDSKENVPLPR